MRRWISEKVPELVRKEVSAALPAAMRAASHAGKEFLKKSRRSFVHYPQTPPPLRSPPRAKP
jgi:hypothetical protein